MSVQLVRDPYGTLVVILAGVLAAAAGCAIDPAGSVPDTAARTSAIESGPGPCGIGGDVLSVERLTPAAIPGLSALEGAQIIAAVQESAHSDVTTVEQAFAVVDQHEINRSVLFDQAAGQFYVEIEFGAGGNSYGAFLYYNTAEKAAAIHDGFQEECGPVVFNYDQGDTAPACAGFLTYTNTASFAALDAFLPSNVAQAIVTTRAVAPFSSVASVVAVHGVAEARLQLLLSAARTAGLVGPSCSGIFDQIALSTTDADAVVSLVNAASANELRGVLAFLINQGVVGTLTAGRPFASAGAISQVAGVGPAVLRALRNTATFRGPFEDLVQAINEADPPGGEIRVATHFDWVPIVTRAERFTDMSCFGIDPALLPPGATLRAQLANSNEVMESAGEAVALASNLGQLSVSSTPGLTDLEARLAAGSFLGCYISSHPNPFVFDQQRFFVNVATGASVMFTQHFVE